MENAAPEFVLPGFRFHPTEEELLDFYLKKMVFGKKLRADIIGFLNIYHHDPWELPGLSKIGEREWYFFVPRNRKQGNGGRPNRTTQNGFWKATGSDRSIRCLNDTKRVIGLKKTLVFYKGRAPRGCKTDWVMNEYRMPDNCTLKEDIVLCKIYRKATSLKVLEQRAEEEMKTAKVVSVSQSSTSSDSISFPEPEDLMDFIPMDDNENNNNIVLKTEQEVLQEVVTDNKERNKDVSSATSCLRHDNVFAELQLPKGSADWREDPFWTQLHSPWFDNSFFVPYANILNF